MNKYVDLHTHSTKSDGTMTPAEIIIHAKNSGISAIALTDHDSVGGIYEALVEADKQCIEFIPGVEISVDYEAEMHILGYFNRDTYLNINEFLQKLVNARNERNPKILEKINDLGISMTWDDILKESKSGIISRLHFAKALIRKGVALNMSQAFSEYLSSGGLCYVPKSRVTPEEGLGEIIKAGGVPVLAHPILLNMDMDKIENLISGRLIKAGLMGIEAVYVENTPEETRRLIEIANKYNLLITGGSDFHGNNKEWTELGVGRGNLKVDYELFNKLQNHIKKPTN